MVSATKRLYVMSAMILAFLLLLAPATTGCDSSGGSNDGGQPDGSTPSDGGDKPDGGIKPDGGVTDGGANPDGGVIPDGSVADGGLNPDGGSADGGTNPDGGVSPDGSTADGGQNPDGSVADGGGECTYSGFVVVEPETYYGKDSIYDKDYWMFIGASSSVYPLDTVDVENWVGYGGPPATGVYAVTTTETAYATCGFCFIISQNCASAGACEKYYMPKVGGTFTFLNLGTAPGGTFSGSLSGVKFQEVTINWETQETTPVPGGSTWCMDGFAWSGTIPF